MPRKRWVIGGALATLALAASLTAGTVFAASTATPTTNSAQATVQTFIDRLAQNLGLSSDQVKQGLQKTQDQFVDDAVAAGKITAEQGAALKQQIASGEISLYPFDFGFGGRHRGGFGFGDAQGVIASTLGLTQQQLQSELSSGKTLKQVITEQGKTVDDVVNAVVAQAKTELDQLVQSGTLTQDQETQRLNDLKQQLTDAINNNTFGTVGPMRGLWGMHGDQPSTQAPAATN